MSDLLFCGICGGDHDKHDHECTPREGCRWCDYCERPAELKRLTFGEWMHGRASITTAGRAALLADKIVQFRPKELVALDAGELPLSTYAYSDEEWREYCVRPDPMAGWTFGEWLGWFRSQSARTDATGATW